MKQNLEILAGLAFCCLVAGARAEAGSYGVTGDIQRRIDAASAAGGGTVTLEAGDYPVASIFLKSGVTLELRKGATLLAYGFYVRHADGVTFENVKLTYTGDTEARPAIFIDDSTDVRTEGCSFRPPVGSYPAVYSTGLKLPLSSPR